MASQGSGGAFEISQRMTAMVSSDRLSPNSPLLPYTLMLLCSDASALPIDGIFQVGWGATTGFAEDWTWQQSADLYALDPEMSARLRKSNPQVSALVRSAIFD